MSKASIAVKVSSCLSFSFSVVAFVLCSGPYTPALFLAIIAMPLALLSFLAGAKRLSLITIFFAVSAFATLPVAELLIIAPEKALELLGIAGIGLSVVLYLQYRITGKLTQ